MLKAEKNYKRVLKVCLKAIQNHNKNILYTLRYGNFTFSSEFYLSILFYSSQRTDQPNEACKLKTFTQHECLMPQLYNCTRLSNGLTILVEITERSFMAHRRLWYLVSNQIRTPKKCPKKLATIHVTLTFATLFALLQVNELMSQQN